MQLFNTAQFKIIPLNLYDIN